MDTNLQSIATAAQSTLSDVAAVEQIIEGQGSQIASLAQQNGALQDKLALVTADDQSLAAQLLKVIIYLTNQMIWHKNTFSRDRVFALLSLLSIQRHAISGNRTGQRVNADPPLTTNHLPRKANPWLHPSLANSASRSFRKQKARSLPKWNCHSRQITTLLKSFFRTKLRSRSISNRVCKSLLSLSIGSLANTNPFVAGDPFTAFKPLTS